MEKKFLEGLGLSDENIIAILSENDKEVGVVKTELTTANTTINNLKSAAKDFEGVDVGKLKGDLETLQTKYNDDINAVKLSAALDSALMGAKARDVRAVKPFLDMSLVKLDGEKVLGLEEQLKGIRESKAFLFEEEQGKPSFKSGMRQTGTEGTPDKKEEANNAFRSLLGKGEE